MTTRIARPILPGAAYTAELAVTILEQLTRGRTLRDVCRDEGMPAVETVRRWMSYDHADFGARFLRAWDIGTVATAQQTSEIASDALDAWLRGAEATPDGEAIGRSLLRIEARCWLLAKWLPDILADRLDPNFKHPPAKSDRDLEELSAKGAYWAERSRRVSRRTQSILANATKRSAKGTRFN